MKKKFFLESGNKIMLLAAEFCFFFWNSGFYVIYKLPRLQKKNTLQNQTQFWGLFSIVISYPIITSVGFLNFGTTHLTGLLIEEEHDD